MTSLLHQTASISHLFPHQPQPTRRVGVASQVAHVVDRLVHLSVRLELIEVELHVGPRGELDNSNLGVVRPDDESADDVLGEILDAVPVARVSVVDGTARVNDEHDVSEGVADWTEEREQIIQKATWIFCDKKRRQKDLEIQTESQTSAFCDE